MSVMECRRPDGDRSGRKWVEGRSVFRVEKMYAIGSPGIRKRRSLRGRSAIKNKRLRKEFHL